MKAAANAKSERRRRKRVRRNRFRNASLIYKALAKEVPQAAIPQLSLSNIDRLVRQHRIAANCGWLGARAKIESRLLTELESIRTQVDAATLSLNPPRSSPPLSIRDVACDLAALETDFANVALDRRRQTLSVVTEPIELDGVYLGPFEICLQLRGFGQSSPYRAIANDPHPASTCDSTTHPHVCDEGLCEGDGHAAIRRALSEGRLFDFFVIVRQILKTYNPDSAYIKLEDWDGAECQDCGDVVDSDDCRCCSRCDRRICRDCCCLCSGCEEDFCDDCTSTCEGCDSCFCSGCLKKCTSCDNQFCDQCLKEDLCDDCLEEKTEKEEAEATKAEVHAACVDEAAIPS